METALTLFDAPLQETGVIGAFNPTTGIWTCPFNGTFLIMGRAGIAANSGAEIFCRIYINGTAYASSFGQSTAVRGNIVSLAWRCSTGDQVQLRVQSNGTQVLERTAVAPIFINIMQSGNT